jgi:hypothetical protein
LLQKPTCRLWIFRLGVLGVTSRCRWFYSFLVLGWLSPLVVFGQVDPMKRELVQIGYNFALQGHAPQAAYAFYYLNNPGFLRTNLALRLAVAPTYMDSELGIRGVFSPQTDVGIGLAGGGFADSYAEVRQGKFEPGESFIGYGGEFSMAAYHLFNPGRMIPLNGVLRGLIHYSTYDESSDTENDFSVPDNLVTFKIRTGLRWGGREPTLFPALAMELSIWYQGEFRTPSQTYGFVDSPEPGGPREINDQSHVFWAQAYLAYLTSKSNSFYVSLIAGTSIDADRFSAYRLGALLPLISEFPLSLPGYYYQELSTKSFVLLGGNYLIPLDQKQRWQLDLTAATAVVDYLPGLEQPGNWHSGVGGGILYKSSSWKIMVGYAYGVDAIRSGDRGAHSIGVLMQLDWEQARESLFSPTQPSMWRGLQQVFGLFGS